jgi:hypothetical protein
MKTIKLFDKEMVIEKEYEMAVCVYDTVGSNLTDYEDVELEFGQKIFNIKILESGSIIFTLSPDSEDMIVTMFPQMFGFPSEEQLSEVKRLEKIISDSYDKINSIFESIERTSYTDIL